MTVVAKSQFVESRYPLTFLVVFYLVGSIQE